MARHAATSAGRSAPQQRGRCPRAGAPGPARPSAAARGMPNTAERRLVLGDEQAAGGAQRLARPRRRRGPCRSARRRARRRAPQRPGSRRACRPTGGAARGRCGRRARSTATGRGPDARPRGRTRRPRSAGAPAAAKPDRDRHLPVQPVDEPVQEAVRHVLDDEDRERVVRRQRAEHRGQRGRAAGRCADPDHAHGTLDLDGAPRRGLSTAAAAGRGGRSPAA